MYFLLNASISAREEPAVLAFVCLTLASLRIKPMTARVRQAAIIAAALLLAPYCFIIFLLLVSPQTLCLTKLSHRTCPIGRKYHRSLPKSLPSGRKRISIFYGQPCFSYLRRIRWRNARKLRAHVVDNVEIAVRSIVISQARIGTHCLRVRSIELNQAGKCQSPPRLLPWPADRIRGRLEVWLAPSPALL